MKKIEEKWAKSEEKLGISNEQLEINRKAEPGTIAPGPVSISIPNFSFLIEITPNSSLLPPNSPQRTMEQKIVKYSVLSPLAKVPAYATAGAAAADLCAALEEPLTIAPMQRVLVPTGLAIELPDAGCVALVYARSGLSIKHGLCMANGVGVVDSDYRGELKVPMINLGTEPYTIAPGERVAQLCIAPVWQAAFVPAATLNETERGEGGFGSTGK